MFAHYDPDGFFVNVLALERGEAQRIFNKHNLDGDIRPITIREYRIICDELMQRRTAHIKALANIRQFAEVA